MDWNVTMLVLHVFVLFALGSLCRRAPGFLQCIVLGLMIAAELVFVWVYAAAIAGHPAHWMVSLTAYRVVHVAMILYVLRVFVVDQERRCLPSSSDPSRSSPR